MSAFANCQHSPRCSVALGCCSEFGGQHDAVPVAWAIRLERRGGRWVALEWAHPRSHTMHRSEAGEPTDGPPRWAR